MTITTLILLLATGIVAVTAEDTLITNCCDTRSRKFFTFGRNAGAKVYPVYIPDRKIFVERIV